MEETTTGLLNDLRTASFVKDSGIQIRHLADQLEAAVQGLLDDRAMVHAKMAEQGTTLTAVQTKMAEQQATLAAVQAKLAEALALLTEAEEKLRCSIVVRFGHSREQWTDKDELQGQLFPELETVLAAVEPEPEEPSSQETPAPETKARSSDKPRGKRRPLPADLPRVEKMVDLPEAEKHCPECGKALDKIGEDVSERLQVIPARFYVEKTIRPKYACSCGCCGVSQAAVPEQVAPKSILGETMAVQVVTGKFCDGLPIYRQAKVLSTRFGIEISEQTLGRAATAVAAVLEPLATIIQTGLANCPVVCGDETRLRVLYEDGQQKEGLSWMWVLTGEHEGRHYVRFRYDPSRDQEAGREILRGYTGTLMADGYGVYSGLAKELGLTRAACMAHARRKFMDVLKGNPKNKDAQVAVAMIRSLYQVESTYSKSTHEERCRGRQEHALPIFEQFRTWLYEKLKDVRPKSLLGTAVNYASGLLPHLQVYLDDGRVPIDNNEAERKIRPFVVGRKAWLFNTTAKGAETSATLYSIIETVKANGLEPYHYLLFIMRCYERFGSDGMDWGELFPNPKIRDYADRIGVPWTVPA